MTQRERVLRALRRGPVNTVDFQAPACDGGKPILRVAARVFELQQDGFRIVTRRRSNATVTYTLVGEPERNVESLSPGAPAPGHAQTEAAWNEPPVVIRAGASRPGVPLSLFDQRVGTPEPSSRDAESATS